MKKRPHVVCEAEPFCYGPGATLLAIIRHLKKYADVTVFATGTTLELIQRENDVTVIACNTKIEGEILAHHELITTSSLALSVLSGALLKLAQSTGVPTAYVDVLFWLWPDEHPQHARRADYYFIEDHFEARHRLASLPFIIDNPVLVPPIVEEAPTRSHQEDTSQLLVTFGGVDSMFTSSGRNTDYHIVVANEILEALKGHSQFERILFTGGASAMQQLSSSFGAGDPTVRAASLGHRDYLDELLRSTMLLSHPGMASPMEAFWHGVPVLFLPAMNYSQVIQLRRFKAIKCAPYSVDWEELFGAPPIQEDLLEHDGVEAVLQCIRNLSTDASVRLKLRTILTKFLSLTPSELRQTAIIQSAFKQQWTANGARTIAGTLQQIVCR